MNGMRAVVCVVLGSAVLLGGCRSNTQTLFGEQQIARAHQLEGDWRGADGRVVQLRESAGGGLRIRATVDGERRGYTGVVLNLSGRTIVEVPLSEQGAMADDAAPVSLFTRLYVAGDVMESEPMSGAWLESQASEEAGIGPAPLAEGEGRVIVGDAEAMRRLLVRAATDDSAWGEAERYERVK